MNKSTQVLQRLRENAESFEKHADGSEWGYVYLDNARPSHITPRSFRSCLASLSRQGLYESSDDQHAFGLVKMEDEKIEVGDMINVFHDPITKENAEGRAKVKKIEATYPNHEYHVLVEFEEEPGTDYFRVVYI